MAISKTLIVALAATLTSCEPPVHNYNSGSGYNYQPPPSHFGLHNQASASTFGLHNQASNFGSHNYQASHAQHSAANSAQVSNFGSNSYQSSSFGLQPPAPSSFGSSNAYIPPSALNPPSHSQVAPSSGYGPPSTSYGPPDSGDNHGHGHGHDNEVPKSYEFGYAVKDAASGNDYGRQEVSDGNTVRGEYRVLLPDGRTQIVTYHADWKTGYHADVRYEGEARYPEQQPQIPHHQQPANGYNYNTPSFGGSLTGFHGNGNSAHRPSNSYGPPRYQ